MTRADLEEYLRNQDSFALELYVYNTAKKLSLEVSHGGSYEDPVTQKTRQYDLRVASERGRLRIVMALECKALRPNFPLLLSRIPRADEESFHHLIAAHEPDTSASLMPVSVLADTSDVIPVSGEDSIYPPGGMVGKSTTQVGRNLSNNQLTANDSEVFAKWAQALASADELVAGAMQAHESRGVDFFVTFVIPVLVVSDGTLWAVDYSIDGAVQEEPHKVEDATLFVGQQYHSTFSPSVTISHIHICTRNRIRGLLEEIMPGGAFWDAVFPFDGA